jgi:purine-nucleoside/S-methyl-5'-thioadenosine phosphorylase / adenosine deaminase
VPVELTLRPSTRGALRVYGLDFARSFGVDAFVTDRSGGVSEAPYDSLNLAFHVGDHRDRVAENRRRVSAAIGVADDQLVTANQVHGSDVVEVTGPVDAAADGLVGGDDGLALAILVADCAPVLLVDESSVRFAVVHAGWRGLAEGVLANAVARFERAASLHAYIGPSISARRYQVGPEVASRFADVPGALEDDARDRSRLNLRAVAAHQLAALGLHDGHVLYSAERTDGGAPFFSDRAHRPCGRFALVARRLVA